MIQDGTFWVMKNPYDWGGIFKDTIFRLESHNVVGFHSNRYFGSMTIRPTDRIERGFFPICHSFRDKWGRRTYFNIRQAYRFKQINNPFK